MAVSKNASGLDPLGAKPEERARRIEEMRKRRWREAPDSDLNILLFAHDEAIKDILELEAKATIANPSL